MAESERWIGKPCCGLHQSATGGGPGGKAKRLAQEILEHSVSVPDFHATAYAALGISPSKELFDGERPVPITDGGNSLEALL